MNLLNENLQDILTKEFVSELDLSHKNIVRVPTKIGSIKGLQVLNLEHNQLEEIPTKFTTAKPSKMARFILQYV